MIRLLIAGLMVLMAGNANANPDGYAYQNETIYDVCKHYIENGFEKDQKSLMCHSYFMGVYNSGRMVCRIIKVLKEPENERVQGLGNWRLDAFMSSVEINVSIGESYFPIDVAIKDYVREIGNRPWERSQNAQRWVTGSMQKLAPCLPNSPTYNGH